jgi:hypothetical protein
MTMLPAAIRGDLERHLARVKLLHQQDLAEGFGRVQLPAALARRYRSAAAEWRWQYVFPAPGRSRDPRTGEWGRHHLYERTVQRASRDAVRRAGLTGVQSPLDQL